MNPWHFSKDEDPDARPYEPADARSVQPDHYPNIMRPGGGYPEDKGHKTDAFCNSCDDQLVDGSCLRCDWGPTNRSEPIKNFPIDPFEDDKAGIRAGSVKYSWGIKDAIAEIIDDERSRSKDGLCYLTNEEISNELKDLYNIEYSPSQVQNRINHYQFRTKKEKEIQQQLKAERSRSKNGIQFLLDSIDDDEFELVLKNMIESENEDGTRQFGNSAILSFIEGQYGDKFDSKILDKYIQLANLKRPPLAENPYGKLNKREQNVLLNLIKNVGYGVYSPTAIANELHKQTGKRITPTAVERWTKKWREEGLLPSDSETEDTSKWGDIAKGVKDWEDQALANFVMFIGEEMQTDMYEDTGFEPFFYEGAGSELYEKLHTGTFTYFKNHFKSYVNDYNRAVKEYNEEYPDAQMQYIDINTDPRPIWDYLKEVVAERGTRKQKRGPREQRPHVLYVITSPVAIKVGITGQGFKQRQQGYKRQNIKQFKDKPEWQWHTDPDEIREIPIEGPGGQSTLFFDEQFDPKFLEQFRGIGPYRRNRRIIRSAEEENEVIHYVSPEMDQRAAEAIEGRIINWCRDDAGIQTSPIGEPASEGLLPVIQNEQGEEEKVLHMCESIPMANDAGITPDLIAYFIGIMANNGGKAPNLGPYGREWLQSNFGISDENFAQMFSGEFGQELGLVEQSEEVVQEQQAEQPVVDPNQQTLWNFEQPVNPQYPQSYPEGYTEQDIQDQELALQWFNYVRQKEQQPTEPQKVANYQGWTNWETWNTKLMIDNEYELYMQSRKIVEEQRPLQQFAEWATQTVIAPHNQQALADAQEWNEIPYEERPTGREDMPEGAIDLIEGIDEIFGVDPRSDETANILDESKVNWNEIYNSIGEDIKESEARAHEGGEHELPMEQYTGYTSEELIEAKADQHPWCPLCNPENPDAPGDLTIPDDWTGF